MLFKSLYVLSASASVFAATALDIAGLDANFKQASIVPASITVPFAPSGTLDVIYPSASPLTVGQAFTGTDAVQLEPGLAISLGPNAGNETRNYTVALIDVDVVGSNATTFNRHWLVHGATAGSDSNNGSTLIVPTGQVAGVVTGYKAPGPPSGSGPHRYVFVILVEPANFVLPAFDSATDNVAPYDFNDFVKTNNMTIFTANYMTVEVGTSTISIAATSSVDSATLSVQSSSANRSSSGESSSSHSSKLSTSGTSSSSSSSSNSASALNARSALAVGAFVVALAIFL